MQIKIPISLGELIDKISILEIKKIFILEPSKIFNVKKELSDLKDILGSLAVEKRDLDPLYEKLFETNLKLWKIEDEIRVLEKNKDFGPKFVELARSVYITNDIRFKIKNNINNLFD